MRGDAARRRPGPAPADRTQPGLRWLLPLLLLFGLACSRLVPPAPTAAPTAAASPLAASATAVPSVAAATPTRAAATATVAAPTASAAATTAAVTLSPVAPVETPFALSAEAVRFHPDPVLYAGDQVSIEVIAEAAPPGWDGAPVAIYRGTHAAPPAVEPLARGSFGRFGLAGRLQATFTWVWDTTGLSGPQPLTVVVQPHPVEGAAAPEPQIVALSVDLLPAENRPPPEPGAVWTTRESDCCVFNYMTQTAAARDIESIMAEADAAFAHVETLLGVEARQKVVFNLLGRLLGQGGFASSEISLTYLDRNPATSSLFNLFAHESTHILDRQVAQLRPTIMTEGLAVFVPGGHFKVEPLDERAAALLALDRYIPLATLADGFYRAQHEIGYLEAGAFIHYLVERFGWERFKAMYASFYSAESDSAMLDQALRDHFGLSLAEIEAEWLAHLRGLPVDSAQVDDLRLTVELYDTLRRYQQLRDPSAYFLTAWLPDVREARQRGITADFLRHPRSLEHIALEAMLDAAGAALERAQPAVAADLLAGVNAALSAGDLGAHPLSASYLAVARELDAAGYEAQTIELDGGAARVTAIRDWPRLDDLALVAAADGGWQLLASGRSATDPHRSLQPAIPAGIIHPS